MMLQMKKHLEGANLVRTLMGTMKNKAGINERSRSCPPSMFSKCVATKESKRLSQKTLWDRLLHHVNTILPWCFVGDFNVITSPEENLGGLPYNMSKSFEFIGVIEACGITVLF
ncbi:hypothetical protein KY290_007914 [Solanum tuberosum]|uniref:Uncharacterized protein n=1 Tax=Solanum tuberosum TaxID=4113 RepID=A0ABQ7W8S5_SOLTU|nr:hypothetical protein KY290_007914 [Solanum tuberosum]